MASSWLAIINPAAGRGRSLQRWDQLRQILDQLSVPYSTAVSSSKGDITSIAREARLAGQMQYLSVGGDGTHHELINGILGAEHTDTSTCTVALLNAGTGNDWARMHGIGNDLRVCAQMIATGKTIFHPAGLIRYTLNDVSKQRYFINVAGMALDGRVMEAFPEKYRHIPFFPGYLVAGLKELFRYRAPEMHIETDNLKLQEPLLTVHAGLCRYSGGGMQFVPHADPARNDFAITCIREMTVPKLMSSIYRLYQGNLLEHRSVSGFRCTSLTVHGAHVPIEADGEFLGYTPVTMAVIPKAFRLIIP